MTLCRCATIVKRISLNRYVRRFDGSTRAVSSLKVHEFKIYATAAELVTSASSTRWLPFSPVEVKGPAPRLRGEPLV